MKQTSRLHRALLSALAAGLAANTGWAAEQQTTQQQTDAQKKEERIEVTGSRIKRTDMEGAAPVVVLDSEQLEKEGFVTVSEALQSLTQTTGSIQNELTQSGFTPNADVINLRGLGPGRVLTLINGRRAADYPLPYNGQSNFVNLGSIPSAAVERIEVLAGGASAIYGSDAVAGVINIILKKNFDGNNVKVRAGKPTMGGAPTYDLQWVGGAAGDAWSLTYAVQLFDRGAIFANERKFMDSYRDNPDSAPGQRDPITGLYVWNRTTNKYLFTDATVCSRFAEYELFNYTITGRGNACGYEGYPATQQIRNKAENASAYVYGTYDFGNNLEAFVSLQVWDSSATTASSTQFWQPTFRDANLGNAQITLLRIFTPTEIGGENALQSLYDEGSMDIAAGLKGTFADAFDWDLTVSRSTYETSVDRPRFLNQPLRDYFLGPLVSGTVGSTNAVYRPDYTRFLNPIDAATFASLNTRVLTDADSSVTQINFTVTGDLFELPAGPVGFAALVETGRQEYTLNADPRILPGRTDIYNLTGTGGGGERDRSAVGVEFNVPIIETLNVQLAARMDKYDDITAVDDAVTYNAGLEWRPVEGFMLRGSYATSFRAPDMHFVFADESGSFSTVFDEYKCRNAGLTTTQCGSSNATYNYSVFNVRQGNPLLEEEEGNSITYGVVWDITDKMSLTVDYYKIELENVVGDISAATVLREEADCRLGKERDGSALQNSAASCAFYTGAVQRLTEGPRAGDIEQTTRGPINRAVQNIEGVDAQFRYSMPTDNWGNFRYELAWSHVMDQEFAEFATDPVLSYRDRLNNYEFRSRMRGSINWSYGDWAATVFANRMGSLPNWAETKRVSPFVTYNTSVRYALTQELALSLSVANVFNKIAAQDQTYNSWPYFWRGYGTGVGREVFLQADYSF